MTKEIALKLFEDCQAEERAHLELRIIRDAQHPRFEALREANPEIYDDFIRARTGPHEELKRIRDKRMRVLKAIIEGEIE